MTSIEQSGATGASSRTAATQAWTDALADRARAGETFCAVLAGPPDNGQATVLAAARERLRSLGITVIDGLPSSTVDARPGRAVMIAQDLHTWPERLVESLSRDVDAGTIGLVVSTEPRESDPLFAELIARARRSGVLLRLEPLDTAEVLTRATALGLTLTPVAASQIRRRCAGAGDVVDEVLVAMREEATSDDEPATVAARIAHDRHHRLIRGLAEDVQAVLVLASLRAPLDPDSIADVLEADRGTAIAALDSARGCGLLTGADVLVSAVAGVLTEVVGSRRYDDLRRRSVVVRLCAPRITADDALHAVEAGIDDPRLVDALLAEVSDAPAARAVVLLRAADRIAPARDDIRLLMAQRALASGDVDGAGAVADRRLESASPTERGLERWAAIAATVAIHRGLASHAADLYRWLSPEVAADDVLSAVIALLAVGDRTTAQAIAAVSDERPPIGARAGRSLVVRGVLASLDAPGAAVVDGIARGVAASSWYEPTAPRIGHALTALALDAGDAVTARTIRDSTGVTGPAGNLIDAEIALTAGDLDAAARLVPEETDGLGADERLRVHGVRLGLARRNDDVVTLRALWQRGLALLTATEIDLYSLRTLGEFWIAAARLADQSAVIRYVIDADRVLGALDVPALWAAPWQFAGVQAGINAGDHRLTAERLRRLATIAGPESVMYQAARAWAVLALGIDATGAEGLSPERSDEANSPASEQVSSAGDVDAMGLDAAVSGLRGMGLHWEAARLAGLGALRANEPAAAAELLRTMRVSGEPVAASASPVGGVLTDREAEVAHELLQGYTYREIGERLFISPKTVEHHVARIRRRLDAGSRSQLLGALRAAGYS